ncbi:hypothetical protein [Pseudomonas sp. EpS/L25]|uniref:hypothetical protein n=1 Tax=Pseudomonas sp. EpS/L25 TaxID=1749078 RepID=UPI0007431D43|nr:hypothetical protein [Pseudomonas sp. EpS/L25]KUM41501.1 hypothetical protein AR540_08250 [Pseudomonas sp. EpS/L25]
MPHPRRRRRRAASFSEQHLQLRAYLEEVSVQDGVHRLQPQDMTLGTRERVVTVVGNEPVTPGHVALVFLLYELDVAQSVALYLRRQGIPLSDQNAIGALGLPEALTHLVQFFSQQINEVAAVRQLCGTEQGLLL